jgi:hypothetical protein
VPDPDDETKSADGSATTVADDSATKTDDDKKSAAGVATAAQGVDMPVLPRTSTISTAAPATADGDAAPSTSQDKRTAVDPGTLREANTAADLISLPRTMSEEWMAAEADDGAYEVEQRRPRWILAAAGGLAVIGAVAVLAMTRGGETAAPRASAASRSSSTEPAPGGAVAVVQLDAASAVAPEVVAPLDAAEVAMAPVVPSDAPQVAIVPVDAVVVPTVAVAPAPVGADVAVVPVTAKPETTAKAAQAITPVATTATKPDATKPAATPVVTTVATRDATVAKPVRKPAAPATTKPPTEPKAPPPPKDERTIEQLVDAREFSKANTACTTNTQFSAPRLVACALAACNTHSAALAARWIRAIPRASRDEMVSTCKGLGVDVATP